MPMLPPAFLFHLEDAMRVTTAREYERIVRGPSLWWRFVAGVLTSRSRTELVAFILDDAQIRHHVSGEMHFDDLAAELVQFENETSGAGLKMTHSQLSDLDALGLQIAATWARGIGARAAYWPQKLVAACLLANPTGYDGKALFALDHPVNPFAADKGTFRNLFTGAASGDYPGAVPIGGATALDTARTNLAKALAYISTISLPDGSGPRALKVAAMIVPPALLSRAQQITEAKAIDRVLGQDRERLAVLKNSGMPEPIEAPELAAKWGGSDTSFYLAVEEAGHDELGAVTFVEREPFTVVFNGPESDPEMSRRGEVEWIATGRNTVGPAHPYLIFRCDAA